jgi:hypothetical protein
MIAARSQATIVLVAALCLPLALAAASNAPTTAPTTLVVGLHVPLAQGEALLRAHGAAGLHPIAGTSAVLVHVSDAAAFERGLARDARVAYVESDHAVLPSGLQLSASSWDASSWDSQTPDASSWDASSWDASSWDASSWDASSWDASSWDASSWDGAAADPGFGEQWGLGAANVTPAWNAGDFGGNVTICLLDTGVDATHPDLQGAFVANPDGTVGYDAMTGQEGAPDDVGHGTFMAGILAARGGNGIGVVGVTQTKVLPVKVMDASGGTESQLADGISYCVTHGARVLSMSLHTTNASQLLDDAIANAQAQGAVLVAASGNDGARGIDYPASHAGVISVGAVAADGTRASFSNYGPGLDLVAPGVLVASTLPGGEYAFANGTSMSTAFVSGAAALLLAHDPTLDATGVASALEAHARDLGAAGWDEDFGSGALDVGASL